MPIECQIANTPIDLELVYRLRYLCYLRKGAIEPQEDPRFFDRFDSTLNNFSFLMRDESQPLATVRISVVKPGIGWTESPAGQVFGDDPTFHSIAQQSYVEANDVEWLVACPRVEHASIYEKMFGFRRLAAPRQYFEVNFHTQLLGIRRVELSDFVAGREVIASAWRSAHEDLLRRDTQ